jgi:hypothetical protein
MNVDFANGSNTQKQRYLAALHHLLNYPFDEIPLSLEVIFEDPANVGGLDHTDMAITTSEYGSTSGVTRVRDDAPGFGSLRKSLEAEVAKAGVPYSVEKMYAEVAVHELGHLFFSALPESRRIAVAKLFGAESDDHDELRPPGSKWQNRISEGIAETFKEAFLPRRYRVLGNRTNKSIPYSRYPDFRALFRSATGGFSYVYGSNDFRVDLSEWGLKSPPFHRSDHDDKAFVFYQGIEKFSVGYGVDMSQFKESGKLPFSIVPEEGGAT